MLLADFKGFIKLYLNCIIYIKEVVMTSFIFMLLYSTKELMTAINGL